MAENTWFFSGKDLWTEWIIIPALRISHIIIINACYTGSFLSVGLLLPSTKLSWMTWEPGHLVVKSFTVCLDNEVQELLRLCVCVLGMEPKSPTC